MIDAVASHCDTESPVDECGRGLSNIPRSQSEALGCVGTDADDDLRDENLRLDVEVDHTLDIFHGVRDRPGVPPQQQNATWHGYRTLQRGGPCWR